MNYFHELFDERLAGFLHTEMSRLKRWDDSDFSDGVLERLPGYDTDIKAASLVRRELPVGIGMLIWELAARTAYRLQYETNWFTAEALQYGSGVGLAIHNDFDYEGTGYPGGRTIVQFSDADLRGGELELYRQVTDGTFEPILTCETTQSHLVGFVISEDSFHAVQPVECGRRMSIVLNLWPKGMDVPSALLGRLWEMSASAEFSSQCA